AGSESFPPHGLGLAAGGDGLRPRQGALPPAVHERREDSIVLVHLRGQFFAMNAWCPHQGGPLFRGDMEDVNGQHCLVCPLHRYAFSLSDGTASCGLRQSTFECKEEAGQLYIRQRLRLRLLVCHCSSTAAPLARCGVFIVGAPPVSLAAAAASSWPMATEVLCRCSLRFASSPVLHVLFNRLVILRIAELQSVQLLVQQIAQEGFAGGEEILLRAGARRLVVWQHRHPAVAGSLVLQAQPQQLAAAQRTLGQPGASMNDFGDTAASTRTACRNSSAWIPSRQFNRMPLACSSEQILSRYTEAADSRFSRPVLLVVARLTAGPLPPSESLLRLSSLKSVTSLKSGTSSRGRSLWLNCLRNRRCASSASSRNRPGWLGNGIATVVFRFINGTLSMPSSWVLKACVWPTTTVTIGLRRFFAAKRNSIMQLALRWYSSLTKARTSGHRPRPELMSSNRLRCKLFLALNSEFRQALSEPKDFVRNTSTALQSLMCSCLSSCCSGASLSSVLAVFRKIIRKKQQTHISAHLQSSSAKPQQTLFKLMVELRQTFWADACEQLAQALGTGQNLFIVDAVERLLDETVEHVVNHEEYVLGPRSEHSRDQALSLVHGDDGDVGVLSEQRAALPDGVAVGELEQPDLSPVEQPGCTSGTSSGSKQGTMLQSSFIAYVKSKASVVRVEVLHRADVVQKADRLPHVLVLVEALRLGQVGHFLPVQNFHVVPGSFLDQAVFKVQEDPRQPLAHVRLLEGDLNQLLAEVADAHACGAKSHVLKCSGGLPSPMSICQSPMSMPSVISSAPMTLVVPVDCAGRAASWSSQLRLEAPHARHVSQHVVKAAAVRDPFGLLLGDEQAEELLLRRHGLQARQCNARVAQVSRIQRRCCSRAAVVLIHLVRHSVRPSNPVDDELLQRAQVGELLRQSADRQLQEVQHVMRHLSSVRDSSLVLQVFGSCETFAMLMVRLCRLGALQSIDSRSDWVIVRLRRRCIGQLLSRLCIFSILCRWRVSNPVRPVRQEALLMRRELMRAERTQLPKVARVAATAASPSPAAAEPTSSSMRVGLPAASWSSSPSGCSAADAAKRLRQCERAAPSNSSRFTTASATERQWPGPVRFQFARICYIQDAGLAQQAALFAGEFGQENPQEAVANAGLLRQRRQHTAAEAGGPSEADAAAGLAVEDGVVRQVAGLIPAGQDPVGSSEAASTDFNRHCSQCGVCRLQSNRLGVGLDDPAEFAAGFSGLPGFESQPVARAELSRVVHGLELERSSHERCRVVPRHLRLQIEGQPLLLVPRRLVVQRDLQTALFAQEFRKLQRLSVGTRIRAEQAAVFGENLRNSGCVGRVIQEVFRHTDRELLSVGRWQPGNSGNSPVGGTSTGSLTWQSSNEPLPRWSTENRTRARLGPTKRSWQRTWQPGAASGPENLELRVRLCRSASCEQSAASLPDQGGHGNEYVGGGQPSRFLQRVEPVERDARLLPHRAEGPQSEAEPAVHAECAVHYIVNGLEGQPVGIPITIYRQELKQQAALTLTADSRKVTVIGSSSSTWLVEKTASAGTDTELLLLGTTGADAEADLRRQHRLQRGAGAEPHAPAAVRNVAIVDPGRTRLGRTSLPTAQSRAAQRPQTPQESQLAPPRAPQRQRPGAPESIRLKAQSEPPTEQLPHSEQTDCCGSPSSCCSSQQCSLWTEQFSAQAGNGGCAGQFVTG
uniref:Rieske domain-containing protein n=1 Tax=Macrostomum lignano TaxID=282301 RepID=A0A1I8IU04_9PLAT